MNLQHRCEQNKEKDDGILIEHTGMVDFDYWEILKYPDYRLVKRISYCPFCGFELDINDDEKQEKSQLQILQEKKDGMVDTKRLVDGLNKLLDDWYRDKENGHT